MREYTVTVGNVGNVHTGSNPVDAARVYGEYKRLSQAGHGRAGGESVVMFCDGEPMHEHHPDAATADTGGGPELAPCKGCKGTGEVGRWRVSGGSRKWVVEKHKPCKGTGTRPAAVVQRESPKK